MKLTESRLEILEPRIAPASTFTFNDVDGDVVKIVSSLGDLTGKATMAPVGMGEQLQTLDLTDPSFQGATISIKAMRVGGDGLVNVGYINATGVDLKSVAVKGDLGQIDAGDADATTAALGKLTVRSMGLLGIATQAPAAPSLESNLAGELTSLTVQKDFRETTLLVRTFIGSVTVGGSIIGGDGTQSGAIFGVGAAIGTVKIRGDIIAGGGFSSGVISANGFTSVTIGGSLIGGDGTFSGRIRSDQDVGHIKIGHDIVGGDGDESGSILSRGNIASVEIGGSILGGAGLKSGRVWTFNPGNDLQLVKVGKDVRGAAGPDSGTIVARGELTSLTVGGSILGGSASYATSGDIGQIHGSDGIGVVKIGGSVIGGAGESAGEIFSGAAMGNLTVRGSILGGTGPNTATVDVFASAGVIRIGGDIVGGPNTRAGSIHVSNGDPLHGIASLTVAGSLVGGSGPQTGYVFSSNGFAGDVVIGANLLGGDGTESGKLDAGRGARSIKVRGSVIGFDGPDAGRIVSGEVGTVSIGRDLRAGDGQDGGSISLTAGARKIVVGGSLYGGLGSVDPSISVQTRVGALTIKGSILGLAGTPVQITAGALTDTPSTAAEATVFGSVTVGGDVKFAQIVAVNGSGRMGVVKVGGDWLASSLAAGFGPGPAGYGAGADVPRAGTPTIVSRIASILIKGAVAGTAAPGDHFGFVAREIGSFTALGAEITPGASTVLELSPVTGDVTLRTF